MKLQIACLQAAGQPGNVEANVDGLDRAAKAAASRGADLLITPELYITGYDIGDQILDLSKRQLADMVAAVAAKWDIALIVGLPESDQGKLYNSAIFFDNSGLVRGVHRKTHLFGMLDRKYFAPGSEAVTLVEYKGVSIAMMICYDAEFPENVRMAALSGAHLIAVPTAQMVPFDFVAEHVVRVRAWENQVYFAYVNHDGSEADTVYVGKSSIVAPSGDVVSKVEYGDGLIFGTVDTDVVRDSQTENPYLLDLRPKLYDRLVAVQPNHSAAEL